MQNKTIQVITIFCILFFHTPSLLLAQKNKDATKHFSSSEGLDFECAPCKVKYFRNTPIVTFNALPESATVKLPVGGQVNLVNRYADIDFVRYKGTGCPPDVTLNVFTPIECLGQTSQFEITIGNADASFDPANPEMDLVSKGQIPIEPYMPPGIPGDFYKYQSENAVLYASSMWATGNIEVEVDVIDSAPIPTYPPTFIVKGTCKDPDMLNHHTWTFKLDNNIPLDLKQIVGNPVEGVWTNMDPFGYLVGYNYRGIASCAILTNNYHQHLITESFPTSGVFFTMADLDPIWAAAEGITTLDQAIEKIFRAPPLNGPPASFALDVNSQLTDSHGFSSPYLDETLANVVFIPGSVANGKIGYYLNQEYHAADATPTQLGTAVVNRMLRVVSGTGGGLVAWHIKKDHTSICPP